MNQALGNFANRCSVINPYEAEILILREEKKSDQSRQLHKQILIITFHSKSTSLQSLKGNYLLNY